MFAIGQERADPGVLEIDRATSRAIQPDSGKESPMTTILKRRSPVARIRTVAIAGVAAVALAVAGCGGASSGQGAGGYGAASPMTSAANSGGASVAVADSKLGKILVDGTGRTLYLFEADKRMASACIGLCAAAWPPLITTDQPIAGPGVSAPKLGTTKRADGTSEVTYNGHPLYAFAGDGGPGQTTGQGSDEFGAEWYVLSPTGDKIESGA
jgi:predicted lipoprotein with Yx(FWY)xxD motif